MNDAPLIDNLREEITEQRAYEILVEIEELCSLSPINTKLLQSKCLLVRKFSHKIEFHKRFIALWDLVDNSAKYELIWDILNYQLLSKEWHEKIFSFMINEKYYQYARKDVFFESIFDGIKNRISNVNFPPTKKWIYLCLLPERENVDKTEVKLFFEEIVNNPHYEQYPFMQEVAKRLLNKFYSE